MRRIELMGETEDEETVEMESGNEISTVILYLYVVT
jgi:hypothetical protein